MNTKRRRQPEKAEQAAIVKLLRLMGADVYVIGTRRRAGDYQGTMMSPGLPDLLAFCRDKQGARRLIAIEVKAPAGRLSEEQRIFRTLCALSHTLYVSGGYDQVVEFLRHNGLLPNTISTVPARKSAPKPLPADF